MATKATENKATTEATSKANESAANREAPQLTAASTAVPIPEAKGRGRGRGTIYPFDSLTEVGMSFGVTNKTQKGMASVVSNQNRKNRTEKRDAEGNVIYKNKTVKDAEGNEKQVPSDEPEMVQTKRFMSQDVDPKTDPDGASVRVWRVNV